MLHKEDKFPYEVYLVAGSQAKKKGDNKIYVMKWNEMCKTVHDDDDVESEDGDDDNAVDNTKDPIMRFEGIPHKGGCNRIRTMNGSNIVATWNDENEVAVYDVKVAL